MKTEEDCKKIFWSQYGQDRYIEVTHEFKWGWVINLNLPDDEVVMGAGPNYIDRDSGLMSGHGSARYAEDVISEFGKLMLETKGLSKVEKERLWNEKRQTFTSIGYF